MTILDRLFYTQPTLVVARHLLGKTLQKGAMQAIIVETEAYIGPMDKGCHAYGNRRTGRNKVMYGAPGHAYVYLIYGMYNCLNIVTEKEGEPCAVLIRAVEPFAGTGEMSGNRYSRCASSLSPKERVNLSNGPGKLCSALDITRVHNGTDVTRGDFVILDTCPAFETVVSKRINIDYAEEARDFPWRFHIQDNPFVSKK